MTRKIELPNIDDLFIRYTTGESVKELAKSFGISQNTVLRSLKSGGVPIRTRKINVTNRSELLTRYCNGESEKSLSAEAGVNRDVFRRWLKEAGISPRNRSDGMIARWAIANREERIALLTKAHAAIRGRKISREAKLKHAITVEKRWESFASAAENVLASNLAALGYTLVQQKAIDIYNIDIALNEFPLAVEVFGGGWHAQGFHKRRFHERIKQIFDSGWNVIIVWVDGRRFPLTADCANYIHAFVQQSSVHPSVSREYRVIFGNGELAPISELYLNTPADIERFSHSIDTTRCND